MAAIRKAKENAAALKEGRPIKRSADTTETDDSKRARADADGTQPKKVYLPGETYTEEVLIPNDYAGKVIGKAGETIHRLQDTSNCRIQMGQNDGRALRSCMLTGTSEIIETAKRLINEIVDDGFSGGIVSASSLNERTENSIDGEDVTEIMIPSSRVGKVIGPSGSTIKELESKSGARLNLIQNSANQFDVNKPLKISGEPDKVRAAEVLVRELLDMSGPGSSVDIVGFPGQPLPEPPVGLLPESLLAPADFHSHDPVDEDDLGEYKSKKVEIPVPRFATGSVIGRNGETIKRLQNQTGARIQFNPDTSGNPDFRICSVSGTQSMVDKAEKQILQIIENERRETQSIREVVEGQPSVGLGAGAAVPTAGMRSPPQFAQSQRPGVGGGYGPPSGGNGGNDSGNSSVQDSERIKVATAQCGLVIGKGGESIRDIQLRSGAYVELDRNFPPGATEKYFDIRGSKEQIESAKQLIEAKIAEDKHRRGSEGPGGMGMGFLPPPRGPFVGYPIPHMHHGGHPSSYPPPGYPMPTGGYPPPGGGPYGQNHHQQHWYSGQQQQQQQQQQPPNNQTHTPATQNSAAGSEDIQKPGEYPTQAQYEANKAYYNSQGYYGVPPSSN